MNIEAHWFRTKPERGETWSVRLNWRDDEGGESSFTVHTKECQISRAVLVPQVGIIMGLAATGAPAREAKTLAAET